MSAPGITGVGGYAPRTRIPAAAFSDAWGRFEPAGIEETAVPAADEDAVTLGYEAGRRALDAAATGGAAVASLAFATTTPPMAEEEISVHLSELFDLPDDAGLRFYTGSTRVGLQALLDALSADGRAGPALVVAADCPNGAPDAELGQAAGAGAAAFVVEADGPVQATEHATHAEPYQGTRFRRAGSERTEGLDVTAFDREAFTTTVAAAVGRLDATDDVAAAAVQAPDGDLPYRAAKAAGVDPSLVEDAATVHELGDVGAASVPLGLARALRAGHERVLAAAFGSGAVAEAAVLAVTDDSFPPVRLALDGETDVSYAEYLRQRGEITSGAPEGGGAYVSVPAWKRTLAQRYRLEAGRCPRCEALNFPPSGACSGCRELVEYDPAVLEPTGTVEAVTVISQGGAPPEFVEQQARTGDYAVAIVAIDGPDGGSASIPAQVVDVEPAAVDVGDRVAFTVRRVYVQEGVVRYGMKFRPLSH